MLQRIGGLYQEIATSGIALLAMTQNPLDFVICANSNSSF